MIRIVATIADAGMASNVGGPVHISSRTFDVDCPELEKVLTDQSNAYRHAFVSGCEVIPNTTVAGSKGMTH